VEGTPDTELVISGLGPIPLASQADYAQFSADLFGRFSLLLDTAELGAGAVTTRGDLQLAVAIWRHMTLIASGEPTLHDIAIGRWPAEATADELDAAKPYGAFTEASVFEMYWCNMLYKVPGGHVCTDAPQDLWRDVYIWNSFIFDVTYETNGVESEWYWFSKN